MRVGRPGARIAVVALLVALTAGCAGTTPAPDPTSSASTTSTAPLPAGVVASIPVDSGSWPGFVAVGFGSVWVMSHVTDTLFRIDPTTNQVTARIAVGPGKFCSSLIVAADRVWVGSCGRDDPATIKAVDPATNTVVGRFAGLAVAGYLGGSIWATAADGHSLLQVDPVTLKTQASVAVSASVGTVDDASVWVADVDADTDLYSGVINRVDPKTGSVVDTIRTPAVGKYTQVAVSPGALWLKGGLDGYAVRVDTTARTATQIPLADFTRFSSLWDDPVAVGEGSVWLRTSDSTVDRLDQTTGQSLRVYPTDPASGGGSVAVGFGSLWVANTVTGTVWRESL